MNQPSFLLEHRYRREHPLWTLLQLCRDDRGRLLRAAFFHIIKHSPVWVLPLVTANVIDILAHPEAHARRELWLNLGVLLPVILQNIPMHIAYVRQLSVATRNIEMNLRVAICRRLQELSIGFYTRSSTGALQAKLLRDVESVQLLLTNVFDSILSLGMVILAALVAVAVRLPWFLVFFALTVPIVVLLVRALRRPIQDRNTAFRREIEGLSSRLIEMTQLIPITRALGEEEHELERVQDSLERVRLSGIRLDTINASFGAASWVSLQLFSGLVLGLSAWLYLSRWLPVTVGDVVLLTSYAGQLTNSVLGLVNLAPTVSRGLESIRSIGEILECPDLEENQGKAEV
ncbi:MAG TPA: ABC transporter ATP-binding protein, partial [Anaerolineales bacterium]